MQAPLPRLVLARLHLLEQVRQVEGEVARSHVPQRVRGRRLVLLLVDVKRGHHRGQQPLVRREVVLGPNLAQADEGEHALVRRLGRRAELLDECVDGRRAQRRLRLGRARGDGLREDAERVARRRGAVGVGEREDALGEGGEIERLGAVCHQRGQKVERRLERVPLQQRRLQQRERARHDGRRELGHRGVGRLQHQGTRHAEGKVGDVQVRVGEQGRHLLQHA